MQKRMPGTPLNFAGYETVMEGADMQASLLTLAAGQTVPWHDHSEIAEHFYCLDGPMVVETRAPSAVHRLNAGESCVVPPRTPHRVHGRNNGPCRYLLLQGVGVYDNMAVGG